MSIKGSGFNLFQEGDVQGSHRCTYSVSPVKAFLCFSIFTLRIEEGKRTALEEAVPYLNK